MTMGGWRSGSSTASICAPFEIASLPPSLPGTGFFFLPSFLV